MEGVQTAARGVATVRERVQKFREKMKAQKQYQMKESKRIECIRKKRVSEMTETDKTKYQEAARERKQKSRAAKDDCNRSDYGRV
jgi:hypothetical protein